MLYYNKTRQNFDSYFHLKSYLWEICHALMCLDSVKGFDCIVAIIVQLQSE